MEIEADSIDNKLNGRKATYIKMDVEGSELESLKGSSKTIRKYRPRLAISLYHKPEDVFEIPVFLEKAGFGLQILSPALSDKDGRDGFVRSTVRGQNERRATA